ncbi:hypothetical protein ABIA06_004562 [Bradyrhizobium yuanmingense]
MNKFIRIASTVVCETIVFSYLDTHEHARSTARATL